MITYSTQFPVKESFDKKTFELSLNGIRGASMTNLTILSGMESLIQFSGKRLVKY